MQRIEVGDAVDVEDDGLAIDDETLLPDLARSTCSALSSRSRRA
jgi:hypothetical protein